MKSRRSFKWDRESQSNSSSKLVTHPQKDHNRRFCLQVIPHTLCYGTKDFDPSMYLPTQSQYFDNCHDLSFQNQVVHKNRPICDNLLSWSSRHNMNGTKKCTRIRLLCRVRALPSAYGGNQPDCDSVAEPHKNSETRCRTSKFCGRHNQTVRSQDDHRSFVDGTVSGAIWQFAMALTCCCHNTKLADITDLHCTHHVSRRIIRMTCTWLLRISKS